MKKIYQWSILDLRFTSNAHYKWYDFPGKVLLQHMESGKTIILDMYWDGENSWTARITPTIAGIWKWSSISSDEGLSNKEGTFICEEPTEAMKVKNPNYRGHIKVSSNGHYFTYDDGTPFFWLGDTTWFMLGKACQLDGNYYRLLEDRKEKGFTVLQTMGYHQENEGDGGHLFPENAGNKGTYENMNVNYMKMSDIKAQALWENAFVWAYVFTWVGVSNSIKPEEMKNVGKYMVARYGAYNVVWGISGEYQYSYPCEKKRPHIWSIDDWKSFGNTVMMHNNYNHPVTVHPSSRYQFDNPTTWPPMAHQQSSGGEFHNESWLDFNFTQTGHRQRQLWLVTYRNRENYYRYPAKPIVHSEGWYENMDNWVDEKPADANDVKWQAWVCFLTGACGHTYGHHEVWRLFDPKGEKISQEYSDEGKKKYWVECLDSTGSQYMRHVKSFYSRISWWNLEPHDDFIRVNGVLPVSEKLSDPTCAARIQELVVVYIPDGNQDNTIEVLYMGPVEYDAYWFSPRSGEIIVISGTIADKTGEGKWQAPKTPDNQDWVLCLKSKIDF